jgi:hypothetical protein
LIFDQVTGPVDLNQLHLENIQLTGLIREKNREITKLRKSIYTIRQKKRRMLDKLNMEEKKTGQLTKINE